MPPQARDLIVTPAEGDHAQGGRIDVSGRTGSIDVGTGGEKQQNSSLDAGAVIDVMLSQFHCNLSLTENLRNPGNSRERLLERSSCSWYNIASLAQMFHFGLGL